MQFNNGSLIEFGYLSSDSAVTQYQSAEYDIIRFDELTHFTEYQYRYMLSRVRGVNNFPKQIKSSTNPGQVGHKWVKDRFIDCMPPNTVTEFDGRTRVFIPAKVEDNKFLMQSDPAYIKRLEAQDENTRKALLYGDWNIFEGQYFPEFKQHIHVIEPFKLPNYYKRFRSLDYGLDTTACYWWAANTEGRCFIYRELHEPNLTLSDAAKKIIKMTPADENISYTVASPDLWNRRQDKGESGVEIMAREGLTGLVKANNRRVEGWRITREYLKPYDDNGKEVARLAIFKNCLNLIKNIPALIHDEHNPEDAADKPHDVTHAPESLRYGIMSRPPITRYRKPLEGKYTPTEIEDLNITVNTIVRRK
jgi:phage terminase large subunit